jgi:hypothetical protein
MSNVSRAIHENSEKFLPAFARLRATSDGTPGVYSVLDFHCIGSSPQTAPGERELNRWVVMGGCMFTVTDAGTPWEIAAAGTSGRPTQMFYGGTEVLLTDRRILGIVAEGETVVGDVGSRSGFVLALSFPLVRVESVSVDFKRGLFGGLKEARLHIMSTSGTVTDLFFDRIFMEPGDGPRGYQRFRGTKRDILEALVQPVVAARRPTADPAEEQQLRAVEEGFRDLSNDDITVEFLCG